MPRRPFALAAATVAACAAFPAAASAVPQTNVYTTVGSAYGGWTVPANVTEATVKIYGAQGGRTIHSAFPGTPGLGAAVTGTIEVTPGQNLAVYVGGQPGASVGSDYLFSFSAQHRGGWNGGGNGSSYDGSGGGGGASDIRATPYTPDKRLIAAGGGGGAAAPGYTSFVGFTIVGGSGGASGAAGTDGTGTVPGSGGRAGGAGTQTAGGEGGASDVSAYQGAAGTLGQGGAAYAPASTGGAGGGGGGGLYGGGSGAHGNGGSGGGGGGGSSLAPAGATVDEGVRSGSGRVEITFDDSPPPAADATVPSTDDDVPATWQSSAVPVTLTVTDAGGTSGTKTYYTTGANPLTPTTSSALYDPLNRPTLSNGEKISYFSVDAAGNQEPVQTSSAAQVDSTAPAVEPSITGTLGQNGWYTGNVTVTWPVTDDSPISGTTGCDPVSITADQTATTYTCSATSTGGTDRESVAIKRDATAPVVTVTGVTEAGSYAAGAAPTAACTTQDPTSGVARQATLTTTGGPTGTMTATCSGATDNAGNAAAPVSTTYTVRAATVTPTGFAWSGFLRPIDNGGVLNRVKGGSSVPVKFSLGGDQGLSILAAGSPSSRAITCTTGAPVDPIEQLATATAGGSRLSYDASADHYTYVWKTETSWAGTCRQLTVTLTDGTSHTALFQFPR